MPADKLIRQVAYVRLSQAAERLSVTEDVLLNLGAQGKAEIIAPVMFEGHYAWPVSQRGQKVRWGERPFGAPFNKTSRVVLIKEDIAVLEAQGWVVPKVFFCPSVALECAELWKDELLKEQLEPAEQGELRFTEVKEDVPNAYWWMKLHAKSVPWYWEDPRHPRDIVMSKYEIDFPEDQKTRLENLFMSKEEIARIRAGDEQDAETVARSKVVPEVGKKHRRAMRATGYREETLLAAIACYFQELSAVKKQNAEEWARTVEARAWKFWKDGSLPISSDELKRLLSKYQKYPSAPEWGEEDESERG